MFRVLRRKTVIAIGVLALASFAGGAVAATTETSNPRAAFLSDLAARLHVTLPQLTTAIKGADLDALSRAVASGRLTAAEAKVIRQRIQSGEPVPLGGLISAPGYARARMFSLPLTGIGGRSGDGRARRLGGPFARGLRGAAVFGSFVIVFRYLGLTPLKLFSDLHAGKTFAEIATSNGKTVDGLERAIVAAERRHFNQLVSLGLITRADADKRMARLQRRLPKLLTSAGGSER
jgi:hypothetical protein